MGEFQPVLISLSCLFSRLLLANWDIIRFPPRPRPWSRLSSKVALRKCRCRTRRNSIQWEGAHSHKKHLLSRWAQRTHRIRERNGRVEVFWRDAALLNRGSSASQTWPPPFSLALPAPAVRPLCHADTLSAQTDARPGLTAPLSGPPYFIHRATCWCFALALGIVRVSLKKHSRGTTEGPDITRGRPARPNVGWTFGLPPQWALQDLGRVSVVVLGQDQDDLEDTKGRGTFNNCRGWGGLGQVFENKSFERAATGCWSEPFRFRFQFPLVVTNPRAHIEMIY